MTVRKKMTKSRQAKGRLQIEGAEPVASGAAEAPHYSPLGEAKGDLSEEAAMQQEAAKAQEEEEASGAQSRETQVQSAPPPQNSEQTAQPQVEKKTSTSSDDEGDEESEASSSDPAGGDKKKVDPKPRRQNPNFTSDGHVDEKFVRARLNRKEKSNEDCRIPAQHASQRAKGACQTCSAARSESTPKTANDF